MCVQRNFIPGGACDDRCHCPTANGTECGGVVVISCDLTWHVLTAGVDNGNCVCDTNGNGVCECVEGFTGDSCDCTVDTTSCMTGVSYYLLLSS